MGALGFGKVKEGRGLSVVELLAAIAIIGGIIAVFYSVFVTNWLAIEQYTVRTHLWEEVSRIMRRMTADGHAATAVQVTVVPATSKTVRFNDRAGNQIALYQIDNAGLIQRWGASGSPAEQLSASADFVNSSLATSGRALQVRLELEDLALTHLVEVASENEIFPRN